MRFTRLEKWYKNIQIDWSQKILLDDRQKHKPWHTLNSHTLNRHTLNYLWKNKNHFFKFQKDVHRGKSTNEFKTENWKQLVLNLPTEGWHMMNDVTQSSQALCSKIDNIRFALEVNVFGWRVENIIFWFRAISSTLFSFLNTRFLSVYAYSEML